MNIDNKLKYLTENHYEFLKNKFDIFLLQLLSEDPDVTDVMFKINNRNLISPMKRSNGDLNEIKNIKIPTIDDSFYHVTGFNKIEFDKYPPNLAAMGSSTLINGLKLRSQFTNEYVICRMLYSSRIKVKPYFELTEDAEYIDDLFETYHLSCQLERSLGKKEIKEKKLKI
jgi:hypothetical protein